MKKIKREFTVAAPISVVYQTWRNFEKFPWFMNNIEHVHAIERGRSHWQAKGPLGGKAEWDAEITLDEPNRALGWRSIEGSGSVRTAGRVYFRDMPNSTAVELTIEYGATGGPLGDLVTKIFSNPEREIEEDLALFKQIVETANLAGAFARTDGDRAGSRGSSMGANNAGEGELIDDPGGDANATPAPWASPPPALGGVLQTRPADR